MWTFSELPPHHLSSPLAIKSDSVILGILTICADYSPFTVQIQFRSYFFFLFNKKKFDSVSKSKLTSLSHYTMKLFLSLLYPVHNFFQLKSIKDKNRWNKIAQVLKKLTNCLDCFFFVSWPFFFFFHLLPWCLFYEAYLT